MVVMDGEMVVVYLLVEEFFNEDWELIEVIILIEVLDVMCDEMVWIVIEIVKKLGYCGVIIVCFYVMVVGVLYVNFFDLELIIFGNIFDEVVGVN